MKNRSEATANVPYYIFSKGKERTMLTLFFFLWSGKSVNYVSKTEAKW
jgi:hypothetical protein